MKRKEEYRKIYESSFRDEPTWLDWMIEHVYSDADLMLLDNENGQPVSALLLRPYAWRYFGSRLDASYIYGACTLPRFRSHGYMERLIKESLRRALERGDALCTLIPAGESLYGYYVRFGFTKAIYIDRERYTAVHRFDVAPGYVPAEAVYNDFHRLESVSDNSVIHSETDFRNITDDLHLDGGDVFAAGCAGEVRSMAFAVPHRDHIHVKAVFAMDKAAKNAVLARIRERFGESMIVVDCFVNGSRRALEPHGMVRLLDCFQFLSAMAASEPELRCTVRVRDGLIKSNTDRFTIADGICRRGGDHADLDVDVETLARILGSSESTGHILGLRATHYRMPLMLE